MMSQLIVVTGMHRSGTSALSEVLVHSGAWFGDASLAAKGRQRPLGLVERTDFLALSEAAMRISGARWHDVFAFSAAWKDPEAIGLQRQFAGEVMPDLQAHIVSLLKDPRLSFVLPLFRPAMPARTVGVLIVRHPLEAAWSLASRNGFSIRFGVALWEAYNRQALISLRELPTIIVQHRRLMRDPRDCIRALIANLDALGIERLNVEGAIEANTIDRALYRQNAEDALEDALAPAQRSFWRQLRNAGSPMDVETGVLSAESARVLAEHHKNPDVPRPGRPDDT